MTNKIKKLGAKILTSLMIGLTLSLVLPMPSAFAAPTSAAPSSEINTELSKVTTVILNIEKALNVILWPGLVIIGGLLENNFLFGNGMDVRLQEIWIPVRNIVNILFVIVLVGIAIYNVLGIAEDNYAIKTILPQIIIGIIAVNFSFLAIRVFLDVVNVLTVSIFSLPDNVSESMSLTNIDKKSELEIAKICAALAGQNLADFDGKGQAEIEADLKESYAGGVGKKYNSEIDGLPSTATFDDIRNKVPDDKKDTFDNEMKNYDTTKFCKGLELSEYGKLFLNKFSSRNSALAMAINMSQIVVYQDVDINELNKKLDKFLVQVLVSLIMYLAFAFSFIALLAVLVARVVVCWIAIALSPVLILAFAVPVVKDKVAALGKILDEFIALAIAPIPIALSMTIGWIMMGSLQSATSVGYLAGTPTAIPALTSAQDLIIAIATIAIVWVGVFESADKTIARSITGPLGEAIKGAGAWIAMSPRYANIIPTVDAQGKMTTTSLQEGIVKPAVEMLDHSRGGSGRAKKDLRDQRDDKDFAAWVVANEREKDDTILNEFKSDWSTTSRDITDKEFIRLGGIIADDKADARTRARALTDLRARAKRQSKKD